MKSIEQTYIINAPISKVWQAFVDPKIIEQWGGGPVIMDDRDGTSFSLWGGDVFGTNTQVIKHKLLEQDWFGDQAWSAPSKISFSFGGNNGSTLVRLIQENIPDKDAEDIAEGWKIYYLGPLKELVEKHN